MNPEKKLRKKNADRIAIYASGSGTNAENIVNYFIQDPQIDVAVIITNNPEAGVIERAKRLGVPVEIISKDEVSSGKAQLELLKKYGVTFIVLAGYIRLVPKELVKTFENRIVNIHPSLLPAYGGKGMYGDRVHRAVLEAGENFSGITIHYVNEVYDEGTVIFQQKLEVDPRWNAGELAAAIHRLEYEFYPQKIAEILRRNRNESSEED